MPKYFYGATSLTGGGTGALDAISNEDLQDNDGAVVITDGDGSYVYTYDAESSAAEDSPNVIAPDDIGGGNGRWILEKPEPASHTHTESDITDLDHTDPNIGGAATELTITSGEIIVTGSRWVRYHKVDTEGDAQTLL